MRIKITESQLSNLLLIKENDDNCHETNDFLVGCYSIITTGNFAFTARDSKNEDGLCYLKFDKEINKYKMTLWLYEDNFMELHIKTPEDKTFKYTTDDVNLSGSEIKISNFRDITDKPSKKMSKIDSWGKLIEWLKSVIKSVEKENPTITNTELLQDIKKLEDLLSYNVDDDDFKKIITIVRKYMKNKEDFCRLRREYKIEYGDNLYEEIISVSIGTQSLVRRFHQELSDMGACDK